MQRKVNTALGSLQQRGSKLACAQGKGKMASGSMWLLLLLSCAASTEVVGGNILRPSCASGWFYNRASCYGYFRKLRSWSDAELECQSYGNGTHLVSILNAKEASVIAKYIRGFQRNQPVWIGLRDLQKNQEWQWIDGTTYVNGSWAGHPQGGNKHCAEVNHRNNFLTWSSNECSLRQHFLCKYQP